MTTRYIPHIIYSLAIVSISTHLLAKKSEFQDVRLHANTHISVLSDIASRMRAGERGADIDSEIERAKKVYGWGGNVAETDKLEKERLAARGVEHRGESLGWRDVILGRKSSEDDVSRREEYDRKDLAKVRAEVEESGSQ